MFYLICKTFKTWKIITGKYFRLVFIKHGLPLSLCPWRRGRSACSARCAVDQCCARRWRAPGSHSPPPPYSSRLPPAQVRSQAYIIVSLWEGSTVGEFCAWSAAGKPDSVPILRDNRTIVRSHACHGLLIRWFNLTVHNSYFDSSNCRLYARKKNCPDCFNFRLFYLDITVPL